MPRGHRRPLTQAVARLGHRIRELREERGLAQAELARRIGSSASHLNKLEGGSKAATVVTLEAIAVALGVGIGELFATDGVGAQGSVVAPSPNPLWSRIAGDLRARDGRYLAIVKEMLTVLDKAMEA